MFDLDKWKEIWATLRSNRLRTFLTAFGVFWGIFMLMAMLGVRLERCRAGSKRQMKGMATNLLFVLGPARRPRRYDGLPPGRAVRFDTDDIELLRRLPGVEYLAPRLQLGGWMNNFTVSYEQQERHVHRDRRLPRLKHIIAFEYDAGRFINERDIAESRKVAVIGKAVREQLFAPGDDPIGKYIKISGVYFQVVGVTKTLRGGQKGDRDANTRVRAVHDAEDRVQHRRPRRVLRDDREARHRRPRARAPGPRGARRATTASRRPTSSRSARSTCSRCSASSRRSSSCCGAISWVVGGADAARRRRRRVEHHADHGQGAHEGDRRAQGARRDAALDHLDGDEGVDRADRDRRARRRRRRRRPARRSPTSRSRTRTDSPFGPPERRPRAPCCTAVGVLVGAGALAGIMPASHAASIKPIEALRAE